MLILSRTPPGWREASGGTEGRRRTLDLTSFQQNCRITREILPIQPPVPLLILSELRWPMWFSMGSLSTLPPVSSSNADSTGFATTINYSRSSINSETEELVSYSREFTERGLFSRCSWHILSEARVWEAAGWSMILVSLFFSWKNIQLEIHSRLERVNSSRFASITFLQQLRRSARNWVFSIIWRMKFGNAWVFVELSLSRGSLGISRN